MEIDDSWDDDEDRYCNLGSHDKLFNQIDELTDALASRDAEVAELQNKLGQRFSDYNTFEQMRANEFRLGRQSRDAEVAELKKDAIRYRMVREYMVSERIDIDDEFVSACSTNEKLDAFVDDFLTP